MLNNIKKETKEQALKLAADLNFWGKKVRDSKLNVASQIQKEIGDKLAQATQSDLVSWLTEHKPKAQAKTPRQQSQKPAADTMTGNEQAQRNNLPVISGRRFIITAVQNNTVPASVWPKLLQMAELLEAEIICLPMWYNKNAFSAAKESEKERFNSAFDEYLIDSDCWLGYENAVKLMPEAAVLPTAKQPINSAKNLNTGELLSILPSPKLQMMTLPRMQNDPIREAWTTQTATAYNYTRSRAGSEAESTHCFGGVFVEVCEQSGQVWASNLTQSKDDGELMFITPDNREYSTLAAGYDNSAVAVLGDLHCERYDPQIWKTTLDNLDDLAPKLIVVHDILHFETQSHHNRRSGKHNYKMKGRQVEDDLKQVIEQLNQLAQIAPVYCVESNHNSALDTWLDDHTINSKLLGFDQKLYYLLNWLVCDAIDNQDDSNALELALRNADYTSLPQLDSSIVWGRMDKPEIHYNFDCSQHGHKGNNGARGNPNQIKQTGLKTVTGHTHSPAILGYDNFVVGVTASLNQGYNRGGGSNWQHADVYILPNGVCQMFNKNPQSQF